MQVCFIPPTPELETFGHGDIHLLLSHLLDDERYSKHYQDAQQENKSYLILDNSAHEFKKGQKAEKLLKQAVALKVQEVVCPDVLFDAKKTVQSCRDSLAFWTNDDDFQVLKPRIMLVPQGQNYDEWKWCLNSMLDEYDYLYRRGGKKTHLHQIPVIGISKDYEVWDGGLYKLFETDLITLSDTDWHPIHLLGWGRNLWELNKIARDYGMMEYLRCVDSAKPFVYALYNVELDPDTSQPPPKYPTRPKDYFNREYTESQRTIAHHNASIFEKSARGLL